MHQNLLRQRQAVGAALGTAVLLTALASCSTRHGQVPAARTAPTSATATPADSQAADRSIQTAVESYVTSWKVTDDASRSGHYQRLVLARYFSGHVLDVVTQNLDVYERNGIVSKGAIVLHPYVAAIQLQANPPSVTIADCLDDRNDLLYYAATGKPIDDVPGGFRAETVVMSYINGTWKVTDQATDVEGTCKLK